jgi:hypothetical protein
MLITIFFHTVLIFFRLFFLTFLLKMFIIGPDPLGIFGPVGLGCPLANGAIYTAILEALCKPKEH